MSAYPSGVGPFAYIVAGGAFTDTWGLRLTHRPMPTDEFTPRDLMAELGPEPLTIVIANDGYTWRFINVVGTEQGILPLWWNRKFGKKEAHTVAFVNRAFVRAEHTDINGHLDALEATYRSVLGLPPVHASARAAALRLAQYEAAGKQERALFRTIAAAFVEEGQS